MKNRACEANLLRGELRLPAGAAWREGSTFQRSVEVATSMLGTAFILLLPQVMQAGASTFADFFPAMQQGVAYIKEMSIGAAIMLFLIFEPEGLIHRWRLIRASFKLYPFSY